MTEEMTSLDPLEHFNKGSEQGQTNQIDRSSLIETGNQKEQLFSEQGQPCLEAGEAFSAFADTIAALRSPNGCPWDREQTHDSIAHNMIEEAYEAVDAIEQHDNAHLREELGDVLLQVVLQSQIAADAGEFTIADVCREVNEKMIRRHPHVFGNMDAASSSEVLDIWDSVKLAERKEAAERKGGVELDDALVGAASKLDATEGAFTFGLGVMPEGLLDSVPVSFPALMQASKISRKAVSVGFEWDNVEAVWKKVEEEIAEFKQACVEGDEHAMELEFGDVLFTLVNVARKVNVDPESALRATCRKFRDRWAFMEGAAWANGKSIEDLSMDELQELWNQAKLMQRTCLETQNEGGHA